MNRFIKYTVLLAATSLCAFNAANAVEKGKFYASGSYGSGFVEKFDYVDSDIAVKNPNNADVFGVAIGYGVTDNIRAELSYNSFYGIKHRHYISKLVIERANFMKKKQYQPHELIFGTHVEIDQFQSWAQNVSAYALFINAYYDIHKFGQIKLYVTSGVGIVNVKTSDLDWKLTSKERNINDVDAEGLNKRQFAWQLGTGVNYTVNDKIDLNLVSYRYSNLGKVHLKENESLDNPALKTKLAVHSISTGITFKF